MILFCTGVCVLAADPDFSGTWKLNPKRSEIHAMPAYPGGVITIQHHDRLVEYSAPLKTGYADVVWQYTTGGKEIRTKAGTGTLSNHAKWEGNDLLLNSTVALPDRNYTQMDHWHLSRDGKTLTIRREVVNLHGGMDSTLVYEKR